MSLKKKGEKKETNFFLIADANYFSHPRSFTPLNQNRKKVFTHQLTNTMAKKQSKSEVAAPIKKNGDGGRIKKPATKAEQTKTAANAVVAASQAADNKLKGILKPSNVTPFQFIAAYNIETEQEA